MGMFTLTAVLQRWWREVRWC